MLITRQIDYVGGVAQLGERHVRNVEATGSNPVISTKKVSLFSKNKDVLHLENRIESVRNTLQSIKPFVKPDQKEF